MACIGIIDYGAGNLMSVSNSLKFLGFDTVISDRANILSRADRLILPGVGAFPAAMEQLEVRGLPGFIKSQADVKPLLGICLGMQMLLDCGTELKSCKGLSLIPGRVEYIQTGLKLPHIGWNALAIKNSSPLLSGIKDGEFVYFVHSFHAVCENSENLIAIADYGTEICAVVQKASVFGCQFHPEKSGDTGLAILKNFALL